MTAAYGDAYHKKLHKPNVHLVFYKTKLLVYELFL